MSSRTMVKLTGARYCIELRTITRERKSGTFCMCRSEVMELEEKNEAVLYDGASFAVLRRDLYAGTVTVHLSWLSGRADKLAGRRETLVLPYDSFMAFVRTGPTAGRTAHLSILSVERRAEQPRFVFCDAERLRECITRVDVRRKLVRFLRDNFCWPGSEKVCFYSDFVPYSFFFQEIRNGRESMCGGLILHGREDMDKAYYSIHT